MPKPVYAPLIEQELVKNEADLEEIISNLVKIGDELGKSGCRHWKCSLFK